MLNESDFLKRIVDTDGIQCTE